MATKFWSLLPLMAPVLVWGGDAARQSETVLGQRIPYQIPLYKLSVINDNTGIRISRPGSDDYAVVTTLNDMEVKSGRTKIDKITYRESPDKAYFLNDFETRQLQLVSKSFIVTLETFEKNLQYQRWGNCLYLDAFLPKFIRGYYLLIGAARNNIVHYRKSTRLFEDKFDVSLNSPRSDERIALWRSSSEGVIKLRIATKELIYQLKLWEKNELENSHRNPEIPLSAKCEEALDLFVRIYFCIQAPTFCPR
jgi:hypothetical protein